MSYQEAVDAKGVKYGLRELTPVDMLDIIEAAENAASNQTWLQLAMMMCAVESIDGVPVPLPTTKRHVRALAGRIGNLGLVAIKRAMFPEAPATEDAETSAEPTLTPAETAAKN